MAWPGSVSVSFAVKGLFYQPLFPYSLKSCLPNDSGFVPDPGDLGREWRFHFEHIPWSSDTAWTWAGTGFPQFWEAKQDTSSCQMKVGICPSALITAIARGCCSSLHQCWIWPWSKMRLCSTSWSQVSGSFCLFYFALYLESIFEVTTFIQQ